MASESDPSEQGDSCRPLEGIWEQHPLAGANRRVSHIVHGVVKQAYHDMVIVVACHHSAHLASLAEVTEPSEAIESSEVEAEKTDVPLVVI